MTDRISFILNDSIVEAVARLVDDYGASREPTHADLESVIRRHGLSNCDPGQDPNRPPVGKQKRMRTVLQWTMDNDPDRGTQAVVTLIATLKGMGGFRSGSSNYCSEDAVASAVAAFQDEPVELTVDGTLRPRSLAGLGGRLLTVALESYVGRAQRGHEDSILVAGTGKDLLEATAAHVLIEKYGDYSGADDFPTLLGQAFISLGLTPQRPKVAIGGLEGRKLRSQRPFTISDVP